jgi:hypothetical protein
VIAVGEAIMFTVEELATIPLFAELGEKELEFLAGTVEDIHLVPAVERRSMFALADA